MNNNREYEPSRPSSVSSDDRPLRERHNSLLLSRPFLYRSSNSGSEGVESPDNTLELQEQEGFEAARKRVVQRLAVLARVRSNMQYAGEVFDDNKARDLLVHEPQDTQEQYIQDQRIEWLEAPFGGGDEGKLALGELEDVYRDQAEEPLKFLGERIYLLRMQREAYKGSTVPIRGTFDDDSFKRRIEFFGLAMSGGLEVWEKEVLGKLVALENDMDAFCQLRPEDDWLGEDSSDGEEMYD